jgi:hypothetical protein
MCAKEEEWQGKAISLIPESFVLSERVHMSEIIHIVTVDVVNKAPALLHCQGNSK